MPVHDVTAQSLDLFNHHERVESISMDVTEYEQLMDFHKRMDQMQSKHNPKQRDDEDEMRQFVGGADIQSSSPVNRLSYQRKELSESQR